MTDAPTEDAIDFPRDDWGRFLPRKKLRPREAKDLIRRNPKDS